VEQVLPTEAQTRERVSRKYFEFVTCLPGCAVVAETDVSVALDSNFAARTLALHRSPEGKWGLWRAAR